MSELLFEQNQEPSKPRLYVLSPRLGSFIVVKRDFYANRDDSLSCEPNKMFCTTSKTVSKVGPIKLV